MYPGLLICTLVVTKQVMVLYCCDSLSANEYVSLVISSYSSVSAKRTIGWLKSTTKIFYESHLVYKGKMNIRFQVVKLIVNAIWVQPMLFRF